MMEYQTWTRKANALAAVEKALANVSMDYYIMKIDAIKCSALIDDPTMIAYYVRVEIDNTPAEGAALQAILGDKACVVALREPVLHPTASDPSEDVDGLAPTDAVPEAPPAPTTSAPTPAPGPKVKMPRATKPVGAGGHSSSKGKRLTAAGANPFRAGSLSAAAWDIVAANPGITYDEARARGARMRAISHCVMMAWMEAK